METKSTLHILTCGNVDDGKSTLIGRLLWETKNIFLDQIQNSKKNPETNELDYSLLLDGLSSEQEQGITIDIAHRQFQINSRRFFISDSPGHEEYTRNMATAAFHSELSILMVNAKNGLQTQTIRHAKICSLLGIKNILLAINKMDLVSFDETIFDKITTEFFNKTIDYNFEKVHSIPISALYGDNLVKNSIRMPWYKNQSLLSLLENWSINKKETTSTVFPVQMVAAAPNEPRGYLGSILSGEIHLHDPLILARTGEKIQISKIIKNTSAALSAQTGESVILNFSKEIDCSRGDILISSDKILEEEKCIEASLLWFSNKPSIMNQEYIIQLLHKQTKAKIIHIKSRFDIASLTEKSCEAIQMNDISRVTINTQVPIHFSSFDHQKETGSFLLIDPIEFHTIALGTILRKSKGTQSVYTVKPSILKKDREALNGHKGHILWMTGLSGSGKSTLANLLAQTLHECKIRTYILDGDNIRQGLNKDLGFSNSDRTENIRRIAEVSKLFLDAGILVIVAFISPFEVDRENAKKIIGKKHITEIYLSSSLEDCEHRDPKGLYKKARMGEILNFTGISSPYEPPHNPDISINISQLNTFESTEKIIQYLESHELIKR